MRAVAERGGGDRPEHERGENVVSRPPAVQKAKESVQEEHGDGDRRRQRLSRRAPDDPGHGRGAQRGRRHADDLRPHDEVESGAIAERQEHHVEEVRRALHRRLARVVDRTAAGGDVLGIAGGDVRVVDRVAPVLVSRQPNPAIAATTSSTAAAPSARASCRASVACGTDAAPLPAGAGMGTPVTTSSSGSGIALRPRSCHQGPRPGRLAWRSIGGDLWLTHLASGRLRGDVGPPPTAPAHSMTASSSPASTAWPGLTRISFTMPARGAVISFSIFMASMTSRPWPCSTVAPDLDQDGDDLARHDGADLARAAGAAAARAGGACARSSSSRRRCVRPPTSTA